MWAIIVKAASDLPSGAFLSFRAALSDFSALRYPEWVERSEADFGMMFLETLASAADDFSYMQDRVAAEVTQAYAQAESAAARITEAESELRDAVDSVDKNVAGMRQTREGEGALGFFNRPQEVVAAIQALAQAYNDYYGAVGDYNRAQFRLYRALGNPAQFLGGEGLCR